jgi:RNA polymerase sigma factor (TIGR02999 family)
MEREPERTFDALFHATYEDLRALAHARLRQERRGTFLDTTALVHESYLRVAAAGKVSLENRAHFMCYAARVMRSVVVDFARARGAQQRGGGVPSLTLTSGLQQALAHGQQMDGAEEILRVNEALAELAVHDSRAAQVVEMRYFGGMTEAEIAVALGVTDRTVRRDWEKARLLLSEALR